MKNQIFVALSSFAEHDKRPLELLKASGYPFKIHNTGKRITSPELLSNGFDAKVIIAGVEAYDAQNLENLPSLRCISRCGVGVDAIDLQVAKKMGIKILNTPGIPTQAVAELALTMFLALSRNLRRQINSMQEGKWERLETHLLSGRTIGLIGFGSIGQRVAELCIAFGAKVIACDPLVIPSIAEKMNVSLVTKEQLLAEADIVSLHASRGSDKSFLIGANELNLMKYGAFLVNLARGDMVNEVALGEALSSGKLGGVGLDVFGEEPYKGPLSQFEQALLTPHSATNTIETRAAMELFCVKNALEFLKKG
jgi:D-3-phosphoglycerate dehydrogenase / 2-oxoglutarate reductase